MGIFTRKKLTPFQKQLGSASKALAIAIRVTSINLHLNKLKTEQDAYKDLKERMREIQKRYGYSKFLAILIPVLLNSIEKPMELVTLNNKKVNVKLYYKPLEDYLNENIQAFQSGIVSKVQQAAQKAVGPVPERMKTSPSV